MNKQDAFAKFDFESQMGKEEGKEPEEETLEESFSRLDQVLVKLDQGDLSLEDAFASYAEGMELVRRCSAKIDRVEKQCQVISENGEKHEL